MARELLHQLEEKALSGSGISTEEGRRLVRLPETNLFDILASTERIRRHFKGVDVNLCSIVNAKSGLCAEDCTFCAQSSRYNTGVDTYPMLPADRIVESARTASHHGAREFSIVTSGTGVHHSHDVDILTEALGGIDRETNLESCASLGIMKEETLMQLKEAGLHSYHHNLETARSFFPKVCTTHDYEDDVETVRLAKELGFYVCSGGVFGLGESWEQRVELAETLRELDVDSVPINFLNPRPATPLENAHNLTPRECLMIIALFRFMLPAKDIVICGGREVNLRELQPLIFAAGANGMMVGNYLTTPGRDSTKDLAMIEDLGLRPRE
ncbi:MAG: biotin synthase BioB [Thermodesulfobacteriota bacterium]